LNGNNRTASTTHHADSNAIKLTAHVQPTSKMG